MSYSETVLFRTESEKESFNKALTRWREADESLVLAIAKETQDKKDAARAALGLES